MVTKAIKIDAELYEEITRLIRKREYKYRYSSISAFVNEAIYNMLKETKSNKLFKIKI